MGGTPHERAEAALTALGLSWPETTSGLGIPPSRELLVRRKIFCIFGAKGEPRDALTIVMKLPVSAALIEELPFGVPAKGWRKQHQWATLHFAAGDDIAGEMEALKGWLRQCYCAVAPKALSRALSKSAGHV